jgi:hypothetical protein
MSSDDLRRSARIRDTRYRPRTTWNLPVILSVECFPLKYINAHTIFQSQANPSHVLEDHMDVDSSQDNDGEFWGISLKKDNGSQSYYFSLLQVIDLSYISTKTYQ